MTRSIEEANELSALDAKVLREIHTDGWQVTGVMAREYEPGPEYAYSIGFFHSLEHPEVILFGLPVETCMKAVNVMGMAIRKGFQFKDGHTYAGILERPYLCCFREVHRKYYREHVGYALWFYESDPFPLLQCFWSDEEGRFPWREACDPFVKQGQPMLFRP